jgi:hypothetical protein
MLPLIASGGSQTALLRHLEKDIKVMVAMRGLRLFITTPLVEKGLKPMVAHGLINLVDGKGFVITDHENPVDIPRTTYIELVECPLSEDYSSLPRPVNIIFINST